ncbi:hypothetical protein GIB67_003286 [Kingdonia uniflora]|uniref:Uncharacterized protein n=1 Tax=Kingdonia uniflora TaxID=39325 RepID=A0A7J7LXX5_9MAGN|nr:hypothetical protein GIB67_003286 [Kingdonia uniflora]
MFYENAISFNVASLQSYHEAFNSVANYAHVIKLVLEDLESFSWLKDTIGDARKISKFVFAHAWVLAKFRGNSNHRDLISPSLTQFVTSFITIRSIMENQVHLQQLFVDTVYRESSYTKLSTSYYCTFFTKSIGEDYPSKKHAIIIGTDKPTMGYLFDALCTSRAVIRAFLGPRRSANVCKIFDHRWKKQLQSDLHATGYILNPYYMFFPSTFSNENLMYHPTLALNNLIAKTISTPLEQAQVMLEENFLSSQVVWGQKLHAYIAAQERSPIDWWNSYGVELPQLQKLAKLNDLVFVQYNIRLERRNEDRRRRYRVDSINMSVILLEDPLCEWIVGDADESLLPTHEE